MDMMPAHSIASLPEPADLCQAMTFLALLDPGATAFTFQTFADSGSKAKSLARIINGSIGDCWQQLESLNAKGAGVFVAVNETDLKGRKTENIKRVRAVWADLDAGLPNFPLDPSILVESSAGKFQAYWLGDSLTAEDHAGLMECIVQDYGGDDKAKDLARVLRVPGFFHLKGAPHQVYMHPTTAQGRRYARGELLAAFPPIVRAAAPPLAATPRAVCPAEMQSALSFVPSDDRKTWLDVGMALKHALGQSGYELWNAWSEASGKYDADDQLRVWESFKRDAGKVLGAGSIFHLARKYGWNGKVDPRREFERVSAELASGSAAQPMGKSTAGLVSRCGADIEMKRLDWLWRNRLPRGMCSLLAGHGGLGKTTVLLDIAARCSIGSPWPDDPDSRAPQGSIVYFSGEDSPEITLLPRYIASGGDPSKIHFVSGVKDEKGRRTFNLQADLALLEAKIKDLGDVALVIFDPISSYFGKTDTYRNTEVRAALEPIVDMAASRDVVVVGNTHLAKGAKGNANARVLDSVAMTAAVRAVYMVIEDADDPDRRLFVPSKTNLGPRIDGIAFRVGLKLVDGAKGISGTFIQWEDGCVKTTADEAMTAMDNKGRKPTAVDEACEFLMIRLAGGPQPSAEIMEDGRAAGHSEKTLKRARVTLKIKATKNDMDDGWTLALPEGR